MAATEDMPKVLISDKMAPQAAEVFKAHGIEVDVKPGMTPEELTAVIGDYDGLAIRSATKVTADILAAATNLKVIGRAGIGVDNVDIPAATAKGAVVMNTPFGNAITTAEHAITMIMALARQIPQASASTHAGKWEKSKFMGMEIYGKTLGVIGAGNIGSIVIDRALGLKMKVVAYDPFLSPERATELGCEKVDLDALLTRADIITLHTPKTEQTAGILNKDTLAKTKQGVRIVNCARGGLVVEADLKAALDSGQVAGAAMDVFEVEPAKENVLFGDERVICTPHLGASTVEAQDNVAVQVAEQMSDYLLTGAVTNALNAPSVSAEDAPRLKPYMDLAAQLGSFAGQITETSFKSVSIELEGAAAELDNTAPIKSAALAGLLTPLMESVNMVNAAAVAKERGIDVVEIKHDKPTDYATSIRLKVVTERQTRCVAGTLIHGSKPWIVDINGVSLDAELGPFVLYVVNEDKPGFIGDLGSALGDAGVNIATFNLGRTAPGEEAISLVQVDSAVPEAAMDKICALAPVKTVKMLRF